MRTDRLADFRRVQRDLQARRDAARDTEPRGFGGTGHPHQDARSAPYERRDRAHASQGVDVEKLAQIAADGLRDRVRYTGRGWALLANGMTVPAGVVIAAVRGALPAEFEGERRDYLAQVVVSGSMFRALMSVR